MGISQSVRQSVILLACSASRLRLVIDYCDAATAAERGWKVELRPRIDGHVVTYVAPPNVE